MIVLAFLHGRKDVLINFWKALANLVHFQPKEVDDHGATRRAGEIAAIAIKPDMVFQPRSLAKAQMLGFGACDDEAVAMKLHARRAKEGVGLKRGCLGDIHAHRQIAVDFSARLAKLDIRLVRIEPLFLRHFQ
jgi:hypothetical protein